MNPIRSILTLLVVLGLFLTACAEAVPASAPEAAGQAEISPLKILVAKRGMVEITAQDLKAHKINLDRVDLTRLSLTLRGEPQPLWVTGNGSSLRLVFFGSPADSLYTNQNVYILQTDPKAQALPMEEIAAAPGSAVASEFFTETVRIEENLVYSPLVEEGEHWFIANLPAGQSKAFTFKVEKTLPFPSILRLQVWSSTTANVDPNHHLRVKLNDQVVIDELWGGIGNRLLKGIAPAGALVAGENTILIEAPGDTGAVVDTNFLNWVEVDYAHTPDLALPAIEAAAVGEVLSIKTGSQPYEVFDVSQPGKTARLAQVSMSGGELVFQTQPGSRYWVVREGGYLKPEAIQPAVLEPDLRNLAEQPEGADYLAVGPEQLLKPLAPLLALRQEQGLRPASIPLQAVYDQFNAGFPEPDAIRKYLGYASQNWQMKPRYLLLVGDATYDPRGYLAAAEANQLPIFFVSSIFGGQTGSDILFAVPEIEILPTLAVGRLPAQQPEQVSLYVDKVLRYEKSTSEAAGEKIVITVSDGQDPSFKQDAQDFVSLLPAGYTATSYDPANGETGAAKVIQDYLEKGAAMIAYFGHGSVNMWGKDRLFLAEEARQLKNTQLPVVVTMTCLNGFFIHPKVESLAEALLWAPDGGAVAVLAPTSLTTAYAQAELRRPFIEALLGQNQSLGEALLLAQQKSYEGGSELNDVQETFLLFGDPALHLK